MSFDPSMKTPDMDIDVSLGEFHSTHDKAHEAEKITEGDLSIFDEKTLIKTLHLLQSAQALSNAETGPDMMFAANYSEAINKVREELEKRNSK